MIRAQIDYDRLGAIARELAATLARTTRSKALAEGGRLAVGVLDDRLRLVVQLQSDVGESYLIRESSRALVDYFAFDLGDGDVLVSGDPFRGGSAAQVLTFLSPVFIDGESVLFLAVRAAMVDLGGKMPGTVNARADETWQEAVRVSPLKLRRNGVVQRDLQSLLERNSRAPTLLRADIDAILTAMQGAIAKLATLVAERSPARITASIDEQLASTRRQALAHLGSLEPATVTTACAIAWPGIEGMAVAVRWISDATGVTIDFAGTSPSVAAPINITRHHARGFVLAALFGGLLERFPVNDGLLETVRTVSQPGSLVDPSLPAATGHADAYTGHLIAGLIQRDLLGQAPEDALGGPGPSLCLFPPIGTRAELVPIALEPGFVIAASGWGAPVLAGRRVLPSAEVLERQDGLRILSRERDGAGGMIALVEIIGEAMEAAGFAPPGAASLTLHAGGASSDLGRAVAAPVPAGSRIRFFYPGHGAIAHV